MVFLGHVNIRKHHCYKITLSSNDKSYNYKIEVLDQKNICSFVNKIENKELIRKLTDMGIYVSDIFECEATGIFEQNPQLIHLLLKAEMAGSLFTEVIQPFPWKNLIALRTESGWAIMGKTISGNINKKKFSLSIKDFIASVKLGCLGIKNNEEIKTKSNLKKEHNEADFVYCLKAEEEKYI